MIKKVLLRLVFLVAPYIFGILFRGTCFAQTQAERYDELMNEIEGTRQKLPDAKVLRPVVNYQAQEYRDPFQAPFQPYQEKEEVAADSLVQTAKDTSSIAASMQVQGIIWGGRFPQAIINNKVVKVGDRIGEARIIEIKKDGITVLIDNYNYTVPAPATGALPSSNSQKIGGR